MKLKIHLGSTEKGFCLENKGVRSIQPLASKSQVFCFHRLGGGHSLQSTKQIPQFLHRLYILIANAANSVAIGNKKKEMWNVLTSFPCSAEKSHLFLFLAFGIFKEFPWALPV